MTGEESFALAQGDIKKVASGFDHATRTGDNTFSVFFIDGSKIDLTIPIPSNGINGVSITGYTMVDDTHLVWNFSDGTQTDLMEIPKQLIEISLQPGNILQIKSDGLYVGSTGVEISSDSENAIEQKADGLYVKKTSDAAISQEEGNEIIKKSDGLYASFSVPQDVLDKIQDNTDHIGDVTTLTIPTVTNLVTAVNVLFNSFMSGITYANKTLTITYRNGLKTEIDLSAIITDTNIEELKNIAVSSVADGEVLTWNAASQKWVNKAIDLASVLTSANAYTDEQIAKINKAGALAVDEKPTYDASGEKPKIVYVQDGESKETTNFNTWFYYTDSETNKMMQTIWIEGVEFTLAVANEVDFSDFVQVINLVSTYSGTETDKTKIPTIAALDSLKAIIDNDLGTKVNTADIVDNLSSESTDMPLSANQGRVLDSAKLNKFVGSSHSGKVLFVDPDGNISFDNVESFFEQLNSEQTKELFKIGD